jgi:F-type H+-transporting ATPase subunit gamma
MKTVSTAKFKKAQRAVLEGRALWHVFPELVSLVTSLPLTDSHPLLSRRAEKKILCLVISSDKGLCGAFNSNLFMEAESFLEEKEKEKEVQLLLIGKKAIHHFSKYSLPVDRSYEKEIHDFTEDDLDSLAQHLIQLFVLNRTDAVYAVYNEFKSILAPKISIHQILPIIPDEVIMACDIPVRTRLQSELESPPTVLGQAPDLMPILKTLLPFHVKEQIRHIYFESVAAEHAARMMAMDNASKNAGELIDDLTLVLNKIRQSMITKELLEIMTAVEAIGKK